MLLSLSHEQGQAVAQHFSGSALRASVWVEVCPALPGGRGHHQQEDRGEGGHQAARQEPSLPLSPHLCLSGILIAPAGRNMLPRRVRADLMATCDGTNGTDLEHCVETVTSSFDGVVVNISHRVEHETMLIHSGLGRRRSRVEPSNSIFPFSSPDKALPWVCGVHLLQDPGGQPPAGGAVPGGSLRHQVLRHLHQPSRRARHSPPDRQGRADPGLLQGYYIQCHVGLTTLLTVRRSNMSGSTGRRSPARRATSMCWSTA